MADSGTGGWYLLDEFQPPDRTADREVKIAVLTARILISDAGHPNLARIRADPMTLT